MSEERITPERLTPERLKELERLMSARPHEDEIGTYSVDCAMCNQTFSLEEYGPADDDLRAVCSCCAFKILDDIPALLAYPRALAAAEERAEGMVSAETYDRARNELAEASILARHMREERDGWKARAEKAERDRDEIEATLDLRLRADQRAIEAWRVGHPERALVQPDHADLVLWLAEERDHLRAALDETRKDRSSKECSGCHGTGTVILSDHGGIQAACDCAANLGDEIRRLRTALADERARREMAWSEAEKSCTSNLGDDVDGIIAGKEWWRGFEEGRKTAARLVRSAAKAAAGREGGEVRHLSATTPSYRDLGAAVGALVEEKQRAYGDSFGRSGAVLSVLYPEGIPPEKLEDALAVVRVVDKLFRIATDRDALGESPWRDVAGYALLALARVERGATGAHP